MELEDYAKSTREELVERIERGKREKDIIILAHNYTRPEVQKVADIIGDSLALSRKAATAPNNIILFAGVMFMAETAKILAPEKTVIVPDPQAGCPLAASATFEDVLKAKQEHPEAVSVAYVNTSAEVKAAVDTCCTSANAVEIVRSIPQKEILFLPDRNLGSYTAQQNIDKNIILWDGACYVHDHIGPEWIDRAHKSHPNAIIIVHPEAPPDVVAKADFVGSTGFMYNYALEHPDETIVLGTEIGLVERVRWEHPEIEIYPLKPSAVCSNMKLNTLEKIARSVDKLMFEVKLSKEIIARARASIEKMISLG